MNQPTIDWYLRITEGSSIPSQYMGPEEQARCIKKCSILREVDIGYSNVTSYTSSDESEKQNIDSLLLTSNS